MHGQTAEAQILVSADWVADVSVCSVALFVSESINRHAKELHAILEIIVDVWSCSSFYIEVPLSKRFRSSLIGCQRAEPISNDLEALFDRLGVVTANVQRGNFDAASRSSSSTLCPDLCPPSLDMADKTASSEG